MEPRIGSRLVRLFVVLAAVALIAAACGGGDDGGGSDGGSGSNGTESDAGGTDTGGGGGGTTLTVEAADFAFSPSEVEVEPGAEVTVTFDNADDAPHTMTSEDLGLDIQADPGGSAEGTFTAPESGAVEFQCTIHPQMKGTIAVAGTTGGGGGGGDDGGGDTNYNY